MRSLGFSQESFLAHEVMVEADQVTPTAVKRTVVLKFAVARKAA